ncbi:MAG: hypothetical protein R3C03_20595 [Pirellulaceae bacterium]
MIRVNGAVISLDALHCQQKTAQSIIDKGGDYVIAVKRNQPNLAESVLDAFIAAEESESS